MRLLFFVSNYLPMRMAGSEMYIHGLARHMIAQGHQVTVMCKSYTRNIPKMQTVDGVRVIYGIRDQREALKAAKELPPDIVCCQWGVYNYALIVSDALDLPCYYFVHSAFGYEEIAGRGMLNRFTGMIFNSAALRAELGGHGTFCHPPIMLDKCVVAEPGFDPMDNEYITLVNLNPNKGGDLFYDIARAMPERKFLGVAGGYGKQILDPEKPANVEIIGTGQVMKDVYAKTKLLLMPSDSESYGMVGVEAQHNGIPVVATDLPTLRYSLGDGAVYAERNVSSFVNAINKALVKSKYASLSTNSKQNAKAQDTLAMLESYLAPGSDKKDQPQAIPVPIQAIPKQDKSKSILFIVHYRLEGFIGGIESQLLSFIPKVIESGVQCGQFSMFHSSISANTEIPFYGSGLNTPNVLIASIQELGATDVVSIIPTETKHVDTIIDAAKSCNAKLWFVVNSDLSDASMASFGYVRKVVNCIEHIMRHKSYDPESVCFMVDTLGGKEYLEKQISISAESIINGLNGVDNGAYYFDSNAAKQIKEELSINDKIVISYVCRATEEKDPSAFVKLLSMLGKDYHGILCMSASDDCMKGDFFKDIMKAVENNDTGNVSVLLNRTDLRAIYSASSILAHMSFSEGFGRTIVEAMMCGCVPIAYRSNGTSHIIDDAVNGVLINSRKKLSCSVANIKKFKKVLLETIGVSNFQGIRFNAIDRGNQISIDSVVKRFMKEVC